MTNRKLVGAFAALATAALAVGLAPAVSASPAAVPASPIQLTVTRAAATAALGYVCSGPTQQAYAIGFDPATGYPDGAAEVSTTCSGSGRDPGSHTYYAWVAATWDFTGYMTSYTPLATAPNIDPSLAVSDSHGNELSNPGAVLTLAPGYYPIPNIFALTATTAPQGTVIGISGDGFTGTTSVRFGTHPATFTVNDDTSITAIVPAVLTGTVNIRVTNPGGTSAAASPDLFTFNRSPRLDSITPNSGSVDGGTVVVLSGANFTGITAVYFAGIKARFKVLSSTSIRAISPGAADPTSGYVVVENNWGYSTATSSDLFTFK